MTELTPDQAETLRDLAREMVATQLHAALVGSLDPNASAKAGEASDRFYQFIDDHTHGGQK